MVEADFSKGGLYKKSVPKSRDLYVVSCFGTSSEIIVVGIEFPHKIAIERLSYNEK